MSIRKGIILSGGRGTRLYPLTGIINKQLLPVYDKPMIYYPLSTLIKNGIKDICIISSPQYLSFYIQLFGNGAGLGLNIEYRIQESPKGISDAFLIAESFVQGSSVALILGDNIFHGAQKFDIQDKGATVFAYGVKNPRAYGVVDFDKNGKAISIEEKPEKPKSNYAVPGYYCFDENVSDYAKSLKFSARGELEITSLIDVYLKNKSLNVIKLNRGFVWLDAGTPETLHQAACYVQTLQERQGISIGCIEEASFKSGFIDRKQLSHLLEDYPESYYKDYLKSL
jgi:glucose-1-phosphate thymidylyltransferase